MTELLIFFQAQDQHCQLCVNIQKLLSLVNAIQLDSINKMLSNISCLNLILQCAASFTDWLIFFCGFSAGCYFFLFHIAISMAWWLFAHLSFNCFMIYFNASVLVLYKLSIDYYCDINDDVHRWFGHWITCFFIQYITQICLTYLGYCYKFICIWLYLATWNAVTAATLD